MVVDALRAKARSFASGGGNEKSGDGSDQVSAAEARRMARQAAARAREGSPRRKQAVDAVKRRAPKTGLEKGARAPQSGGGRKEIAARLQRSGEMRSPIPDATLEPASDPRYMEAYGRGDVGSGSWFGESEEAPADPYSTYFAQGETGGMEFGPFVQEMLDERDHEGGHYAYEDEHEEGSGRGPLAADDPYGVTGGQL